MLGRIIPGTGTAKVAINTRYLVTAIEQDDLDIRQPKTLADVFMGVPGARIAGASARMLGQALNIRGIGNAEQVASEGRIDVLRGPASSRLFGSGVIGGVIAFTTRDGSDYRAEGESTALKFRGGYATNGDTWKTCVTWAHRMGNAEFLASIHRSRGGVMHDLSESLPVFGTLASTRRMPTLDELYSYRPQVASLTLRKEAARTGELGLAWALQQGALEGLGVNLTVENVFDADYRNNLALDKAPGMNVKLAIGKSLRWRVSAQPIPFCQPRPDCAKRPPSLTEVPAWDETAKWTSNWTS